MGTIPSQFLGLDILTPTSEPRGRHMTQAWAMEVFHPLTSVMAQRWTPGLTRRPEPSLELLLELCGMKLSLLADSLAVRTVEV